MASKLEKLSHYGILVVALSAVFISVWQVKILQDHNKLSVKPLMDFHLVTNRKDSVLTVSISNRGIGPAIIQEISYTYQDSTYSEFYSVLMNAGVLDNVQAQVGYGKNTVLSPDSEYTILKVKKETPRIGIAVKIVYQSIYKEEFEKNFSF